MVYLDNAATTKPKFFRSDYPDLWMNSNTTYFNLKFDGVIEEAEQKIKNCFGVNSGCVVFFRCASEITFWLNSLVGYKFGNILCNPLSHDSIYNIKTKNQNSVLPKLYIDQLINPVTGDNVSNIELPNTLLSTQDFVGCDYTAAIGHIVLPKSPKYDFIFCSAHKFGGEKNIGCLWINDRLCQYIGANSNIKNNHGLIHGTTDIQGVCMMADAMSYACCHIINSNTLLNRFFTECQDLNMKLLTHDIQHKTYAINAIYIPDVNADALQMYLATKDIYIGVAHSACSGASDYRVLSLLGYDKEIASKTIRLSFNSDNTINEMIRLSNEIKKFKEIF